MRPLSFQIPREAAAPPVAPQLPPDGHKQAGTRILLGFHEVRIPLRFRIALGFRISLGFRIALGFVISLGSLPGGV